MPDFTIKIKIENGQAVADLASVDRALQDVISAVNKYENSEKEARDEHGRFIPKTKQAGDAIDVMGDSADRGGFSLKNFTDGIAGAAFAFNQVQQAGQMVVSAISQPLDAFMELESGMANVASLGVTNIGGLTSGVRELAVTIPGANIPQLTDGLYQVVSAGADSATQMDVLTAATKAASAGNTEISSAVNLAAAVVKGYGKDWSETNSVMDLAFQTVKLGQTTFPELASSVGKVIPQASALNISSEELFGTFATLTGVTGNTAEVATQLKAVMTGLSAPTDELTDIVKQYGFVNVEAAVRAEGLGGILQIVQEETGGSAAKMNELFGSVEAVTALLALTGDSYDDYIAKTAQMGEASGEMERAYGKVNASLEKQIELLGQSWDELMIEAAELIVPVVKGAVDFGLAVLKMEIPEWVITSIQVTTASIAAMGITTAIATGTMLPALATLGTAIGVFAINATIALSSIPFVGWAAAVVTAIGVLTYKFWPWRKEMEETKTTAEQLGLTQEEFEKKFAASAVSIDMATMSLEEYNKAVAAAVGAEFIGPVPAEAIQSAISTSTTTSATSSTTTVQKIIIRPVEEDPGWVERWFDDLVVTAEDAEKQFTDSNDRSVNYLKGGLASVVGDYRVSYQQIAGIIDSQAAAGMLTDDEARAAQRTNLESWMASLDLSNAKEYQQYLELTRKKKELDEQDLAQKKAKLSAYKSYASAIYQQAGNLFTQYLDIQAQQARLAYDLEMRRIETTITREREKLEIQLESTTDIEKRADLEKAIAKLQKDEAAALIEAEGLKREAAEKEKKLKIAQTWMTTLQMAVSSYNALAGIPFVGPALGIAAAAVALAFGKKQVDIIKETPAYTKGGSLGSAIPEVIDRGDYGDGEDVLVRANSREYIVNANATSKNYDLLEYINQGGIISFREGGALDDDLSYARDFTIRELYQSPNSTMVGSARALMGAGNAFSIDMSGVEDRLERIESALKDMTLKADIDATELALIVERGEKSIARRRLG